jgi:hypothetical protein
MNTLPDYVKEFCRWRDAPPGKRRAIVADQIVNRVDTVAPIENATADTIMDTIVECGKRLADCTREDLFWIVTWHRELELGAAAARIILEVKSRQYAIDNKVDARRPSRRPARKEKQAGR